MGVRARQLLEDALEAVVKKGNTNPSPKGHKVWICNLQAFCADDHNGTTIIFGLALWQLFDTLGTWLKMLGTRSLSLAMQAQSKSHGPKPSAGAVQVDNFLTGTWKRREERDHGRCSSCDRFQLWTFSRINIQQETILIEHFSNHTIFHEVLYNNMIIVQSFGPWSVEECQDESWVLASLVNHHEKSSALVHVFQLIDAQALLMVGFSRFTTGLFGRSPMLRRTSTQDTTYGVNSFREMKSYNVIYILICSYYTTSTSSYIYIH